MPYYETMRADVVVVGGGVAGLAAALKARDRRVVLVAKSAYARGGSSPVAQGGIAVAVGEDDNPDLHAADTIAAGAGLCDEHVVRQITSEGPTCFRELCDLGAVFDTKGKGRPELGREGAHRRRRVAHAAGDATGAELVRTLALAVADAPHVRIVDKHFVVDLLVDRGRVVGVMTLGANGQPLLIAAASVVLATGGIGQLFEHTTNPAEATGDGLALAARVGARLAGLEFVQFHPTALDAGGRPLALLSEAVRGEGALLVDSRGERFMLRVHEMAELAPRDVVARAISRLRRDGHQVFLDATHLSETIERRFPTVSRLCRDRGIDPARQPLPVVPAAHYHMGGVVTDLDGRTTVPGLWACGEVGFTGLHGANRLASNSLLEALVIGSRCGETLAVSPAIVAAPTEVPEPPVKSPWISADAGQEVLAARVRTIVEEGAGVERRAAGLAKARIELAEVATEIINRSGELKNLVIVGSLLLQAAEARTESRGAHYREDFPWPSRCWQQNLVFEGRRLLLPRPMPAVAMA